MLFRSELLHKIGLLDEKTFLFLEEFILHEKIRKTEYRTVIVPSSMIIHKGHASMKRIQYGIRLHSYRSLIYYLFQHRHFGKTATIFSLLSVGVASGVGVLKMFFTSIFSFPSKILGEQRLKK